MLRRRPPALGRTSAEAVETISRRPYRPDAEVIVDADLHDKKTLIDVPVRECCGRRDRVGSRKIIAPGANASAAASRICEMAMVAPRMFGSGLVDTRCPGLLD